jgi:uncharacterized membrane protein YgaE (UPF0421/DUF939 family)
MIDKSFATKQSLLVGAACVVCLLISERLGLVQSDLAVWTTFLVMSQYAFTSFQKGIERIVGRAVGILCGLVLTTWFHDTGVLTLILIATLLTAFFYIYFAGRLAYTFLQAGLYLVAMFQIGQSRPGGALPVAEELFVAIVLGVVVADMMSWLFGAESDLSIQLGKTPLFPLHAEWLSQSLMLSVTVMLTLLGAHVIGLSPEQSAISVMLLTITPHVQAMIHKGELRIEGALLASLWAVLTFVLVGILPNLPLFALMIFLGQFLATYLTITGGDFSYAGLQMGLVLPMISVATRAEFGNLDPAIQRLEGIVLGLLASIVVAVFWPRFPLADQVTQEPAPAMPGEMDV